MRLICDLEVLVAISDADTSRPNENAAFRESPVKKTTLSTPLLRLAPSIDHKVDGDFETPKLASEPAVLLSAASKVRLDHEQVKVAARLRFPSSTRAEQDDVRVRCRRHKPAPRLLDQVLLAHDHELTVVAIRDRLRWLWLRNRPAIED